MSETSSLETQNQSARAATQKMHVGCAGIETGLHRLMDEELHDPPTPMQATWSIRAAAAGAQFLNCISYQAITL